MRMVAGVHIPLAIPLGYITPPGKMRFAVGALLPEGLDLKEIMKGKPGPSLAPTPMLTLTPTGATLTTP